MMAPPLYCKARNSVKSARGPIRGGPSEGAHDPNATVQLGNLFVEVENIIISVELMTLSHFNSRM